MKSYFKEEMPSKGYALTLDELAEAYRSSNCAPQRVGIIHDVARRGSNGPVYTNEATAFLLQIASEAELFEGMYDLRNLALRLFLQRVLPNVDSRDTECRLYIVRFFATEPDLRDRPGQHQHVERFLSGEWQPVTNVGWEPIPESVLITASINTGMYELLVRNHAFPAIPQLYDLLAVESGAEMDPLKASFWPNLTSKGYLDLIERRTQKRRDLATFEDDCVRINVLSGFHLDYSDGDMGNDLRETAQALSSLLNILLSRRHLRFGQ